MHLRQIYAAGNVVQCTVYNAVQCNQIRCCKSASSWMHLAGKKGTRLHNQVVELVEMLYQNFFDRRWYNAIRSVHCTVYNLIRLGLDALERDL